MPGLNQKGPNGEGPMTGRRMGRCTDFGARGVNRNKNLSENDADQTVDRGRGRGRGAGRGLGRGRQDRSRKGW